MMFWAILLKKIFAEVGEWMAASAVVAHGFFILF